MLSYGHNSGVNIYVTKIIYIYTYIHTIYAINTFKNRFDFYNYEYKWRKRLNKQFLSYATELNGVVLYKSQLSSIRVDTIHKIRTTRLR